MTKVSFSVPDMHCSSCAMTLEGLEDTLDGVVRVVASYQKQRLDVEYDDARLTRAQIMAAAEELGYTLVPA